MRMRRLSAAQRSRQESYIRPRTPALFQRSRKFRSSYKSIGIHTLGQIARLPLFDCPCLSAKAAAIPPHKLRSVPTYQLPLAIVGQYAPQEFSYSTDIRREKVFWFGQIRKEFKFHPSR